ncbi:MAG: DUF5615 family PIN-like protein [Acidobacteria bacterium]|nr:DUF5615 family PIN-like protein [Acidobacteriota bacterium]
MRRRLYAPTVGMPCTWPTWGLDGASDFEILDFARIDGRVCVTLDHDFHAHSHERGRPDRR